MDLMQSKIEKNDAKASVIATESDVFKNKVRKPVEAYTLAQHNDKDSNIKNLNIQRLKDDIDVLKRKLDETEYRNNDINVLKRKLDETEHQNKEQQSNAS
eukprot:13973538-Ditylum_brightwellii.AAC.2